MEKQPATPLPGDDDRCISCSSCCPFRIARRDEATGEVYVGCRNPAMKDIDPEKGW